MRAPDVLPVQVGHHVQRGLGSNRSRVLQHRVHEVLKLSVKLLVFALGIDVLDVVHYVVLQEGPQGLVLTPKQLEEELVQLGRLYQGLVPGRDFVRSRTPLMMFK